LEVAVDRERAAPGAPGEGALDGRVDRAPGGAKDRVPDLFQIGGDRSAAGHLAVLPAEGRTRVRVGKVEKDARRADRKRPEERLPDEALVLGALPPSQVERSQEQRLRI